MKVSMIGPDPALEYDKAKSGPCGVRWLASSADNRATESKTVGELDPVQFDGSE